MQAKQGGHEQNATIAALNVRCMDDGLEQQAFGVYQDMTLLAPDLLAAVIARRVNAAPPFSALLTLWLSMIAASGWRPAPPTPGMPHRARGECARACRRRPIGRSSRAGCCAAAGPWGSRPIGSPCCGRDQWGNQRPFLVGQVTWVAQLATVVATTVLTRPHQRLPPDRNAAKEITTNSKNSRCSRMDTKIIDDEPSDSDISDI